MSQGVELGPLSLCDLLLNDVILSLKVGCVEITGGACNGQYGDVFRVLKYTRIFPPLVMPLVQGPKITFMACFLTAIAHSHG